MTPTLDPTTASEDAPYCHAGKDGDCIWKECPQLRDNEPKKSSRSCPLEDWERDDEY